MFSAKGMKMLALAAFAGVMGFSAAQSIAAPFMTVKLLGRVTGSGASFTSSVNLTSTAQTVDYEVQFTLAPEGTTNPFADHTTIGDWVTSVPAPDAGDPVSPDPTSGASAIRFSLSQTSGSPPKANFNQTAAANTTNNGAWNNNSGVSNGTPTARGDGALDLIGVTLIRASGTFDGIDASGNPAPVLVTNPTNSKSKFQVQGTGSGVVDVGTKGLVGTDLFLGLRWLDAQGADVNTTVNVTQQQASAAAGNPIVAFQGLTVNVAPEPTGLALLGVAGLGLIRRRKA